MHEAPDHVFHARAAIRVCQPGGAGPAQADAYGYGILEVAPVLLASGVDAISLVSFQDAVRLRRQGIRAPILMYAGVPLNGEAISAVEQHDLMPTVLDMESARALSKHRNARGNHTGEEN